MDELVSTISYIIISQFDVTFSMISFKCVVLFRDIILITRTPKHIALLVSLRETPLWTERNALTIGSFRMFLNH